MAQPGPSQGGSLSCATELPAMGSKGDVDCPPCGEAGIKRWGRSCRACLYMEICCRGFAARPGQCLKLPGWLCFWPDVKAQEIMLKQVVVLLVWYLDGPPANAGKEELDRL